MYNNEEQEKVERVLKHFNEAKNAMSSDIELIKNDIRTNENTKKNQEKIFVDRVDMMKQKQKKHTEQISKIESELKTNEEAITNNRKSFQDDIRKFEMRNKDTEQSIQEKLDSFREQLHQAKNDLNGQFKEEVKSLNEMTEDGMKELKGKVDTLTNGDIANSTREIAGFRHKIEGMVDTVSEMTAQVKEMTRDKDTNILVHGLPTQVATIAAYVNLKFLQFFNFRKTRILTF
jgi:hypothetical protein